MKKRIGFWGGHVNSARVLSLIVLAMLVALLGGCPMSRSEILTQEQLQSLVNDKFMSPQIRQLEVLSPFINVQLYLETPRLTLEGDFQPLGFQFKGTLDADVFSDYLEGGVTDPIPFQIEGYANLEYRPDDRAFFFSDVRLENARIDLDIAMIETLVSDLLKKALIQELGSLPVIPLDEGDALYRKLGRFPAAVRVEQGKLVIIPKANER